MNDYVCSNCGARCGEDARMGSPDHYLVCKCASPENSYWVSEGSRGGYTEHLNGAHPIPARDYGKRLGTPREENGPNGYPINNPAFDAAVRKVLDARKDDAEQAERFLKKLSEGLRKASKENRSEPDWDNWGREDD